MLLASGEGDQVAAANLIRALQPDIERLCVHLGDTDSTEDLVQESLLRILRSASTFRGDSSAKTWALRICRNVCADHVRSRQRQRRLNERIRTLPQDWSTTPAGVSHHLLDDVDPAQREAFVLTQLQGLSYADAAAVLDCPIGTIRSRVARARAQLLSLATTEDPVVAAHSA